MYRKPQGHAQGAGKQAHQHKFKAVGQRNGALRLTQHAQHGAIVQVFGGKATRHDGHSHRTEQGRQQADQIEEFLGTVQRLAHLRPAAVQRLNAQSAYIVFIEYLRCPRDVSLDSPVLTGHGQTVGAAAAWLDQAGGRNVGLIEHDARRKTDETASTVRLTDNDLADPQARIAQQQGLAHFQAQSIQQRSLHPHRTGSGNLTRELSVQAGALGHA